MTSNTRVVVIGAGLAGVRLARRLGELGTPVTLIGEEEHRPYNRVLLAEVLAGRYTPEVIALPAPAALTRARVTGIDRAARTVECADGSKIAYGTLVLATGSNPVLPPLRGLFTPDHVLPEGVHAFRTMDDCLGLSKAVRPGVKAVVIGGGLLGVSAARALAQRGAQVILAQQSERLMERQLDPSASKLVRRHLRDLGVEVHTDLRVRDVRCVGGAVRSVEMADGYALDAEIVVLACGVHPRVGLAQTAGLDVRKGIVVDDELRTSDPHIHAIGDCAQHDGTVYGLATPALEQADVLAELLADGAGNQGARYTGTRSLTRLTLPGQTAFDLAAFGETEALPGDDVVQLADATRGTYRKVVVRDDRLVGGVLVGELGTVGALARAWEGAEPLPSDGGPLLHLLTNDGGS
ncbi:assimilatory nitrate reductase electron transfer subunit [Streptomyces sp. SAI-208]|uniref:NAD(P)/FAD-dependent oxidoreductase n=1 Tax=unclassified Streptomyces TaxID=2593676 RepID=UPI0024760175|nr:MULTISPECIES: FAD-dependent oxidoreductase [unclassified Streptomyces]MDH6519226.1 assimilatory nitrate reductase electron transfer subunit [Streptomyces sp. SAI-090]MDH6551448.1 assimilatory nitrate reductase electron transfer subunit [Streptomyces sp. SAI-041]MDH6570529.1 assimilatory nitrate reductase electron transfer subunit [Streptomyces sp. SAI-117]MDH6584503.1 assimilatory nitrate reductase electron transfer subunit [Streptomyces sp. SAI-133]MDH6610070.1 assimilatory nitrate reducta